MGHRCVRGLVTTAVAGLVWLTADGGTALAHGWSLQAPATPSGSTFTIMHAVSCASSSSCTAVGQFNPSANPYTTMTFAEAWDGTSWTLQSTPNVSGGPSSALAGVSCPSSTACIAVGWSLGWTDQPYFTAPLAERWDGSSWTLQSPPVPANATNSQLDGVSCFSTNDCTAVGTYNDTAGDEALAEHWDGSTWTIQTGASPPVGSLLQGVSCTSGTSCAAVGDTGDTSAGALTFAERWNGLAWSPQPTPNPVGSTYSALSGVSCASASACTAVGGSALDPGTLAEAWNGATWSIQQTPTLPATGQLNGVSCPTTGACTAVGTANGAIAERWDGTSWKLQHVPSPSSSSGSTLQSISCIKPNDCMAIGSYTTSSNSAYQPLAERYS